METHPDTETLAEVQHFIEQYLRLAVDDGEALWRNRMNFLLDRIVMAPYGRMKP